MAVFRGERSGRDRRLIVACCWPKKNVRCYARGCDIAQGSKKIPLKLEIQNHRDRFGLSSIQSVEFAGAVQVLDPRLGRNTQLSLATEKSKMKSCPTDVGCDAFSRGGGQQWFFDSRLVRERGGSALLGHARQSSFGCVWTAPPGDLANLAPKGGSCVFRYSVRV